MSYPQAPVKVVRFVAAEERRAHADLAKAMALIEGLPAGVLPEQARQDMLRVAEPYAAPPSVEDAKLGVFVMISREETGEVWRMIREELSPKDRPHDVRAVFDQVLLSVKFNTGVVEASRQQISERAKVPVQHVSHAMGVLERWRVLVREVEKVPGVRGRGRVKWRINARVGWCGNGREEQAAEDLPLFSVVQGGKREHHAARDLAPTL